MRELLQVSFIIRENRLVPETEADELKIKLFRSPLPEGTRVEAFFAGAEGRGPSPLQLAKVNILCRTLASHTGNTTTDVKRAVKEKAGLFASGSEKEVKSFANCTQEELSLAIEVCYAYGGVMGVPLD
jgi:hypothetical protein